MTYERPQLAPRCWAWLLAVTASHELTLCKPSVHAHGECGGGLGGRAGRGVCGGKAGGAGGEPGSIGGGGAAGAHRVGSASPSVHPVIIPERMTKIHGRTKPLSASVVTK